MSATAFPRVQVVSVEVQQIEGEGQKKPKTIAQLFAPDDEQQAIERATGLLTSNHKLVYNLNIQGVSETGAKTTARAFVRSKNAFEPSIIDVENISMVSGDSVLERMAETILDGPAPDSLPSVTDSYAVRVSVEK